MATNPPDDDRIDEELTLEIVLELSCADGGLSLSTLDALIGVREARLMEALNGLIEAGWIEIVIQDHEEIVRFRPDAVLPIEEMDLSSEKGETE